MIQLTHHGQEECTLQVPAGLAACFTPKKRKPPGIYNQKIVLTQTLPTLTNTKLKWLRYITHLDHPPVAPAEKPRMFPSAIHRTKIEFAESRCPDPADFKGFLLATATSKYSDAK